MNESACPFESDVLLAALQSRPLADLDPALRAHIRLCPACSGLATVTAAFDAARQQALSTTILPPASLVWRRARLRARHEDAQAAGRPITAVQVLAFATAMGLLGACFGATSATFQRVLRRAVSFFASSDLGAWLSSAAAHCPEPSLLLWAFLALALLLPAAILLALTAD